MGVTDRPTGEIVVLIFALAGSVILILVGGGIVVLTLEYPERDYTSASSWLAHASSALVAGVLGYLAGRTGRAASNEPIERRSPPP